MGMLALSPRAVRCAVATAKFSDLLGKPDDQEVLSKTGIISRWKRRACPRNLKKLKYIPTCLIQQVRLDNCCGPGWPCVSLHGVTRVGTPSQIIFSHTETEVKDLEFILASWAF